MALIQHFEQGRKFTEPTSWSDENLKALIDEVSSALSQRAWPVESFTTVRLFRGAHSPALDAEKIW